MRALSIISWILAAFLALLSAFFFFVNQDLNSVFAGLWVPVFAVLGLQFYLISCSGSSSCMNEVAKTKKSQSKKSIKSDSKASKKTKKKE